MWAIIFDVMLLGLLIGINGNLWAIRQSLQKIEQLQHDNLVFTKSAVGQNPTDAHIN